MGEGAIDLSDDNIQLSKQALHQDFLADVARWSEHRGTRWQQQQTPRRMVNLSFNREAVCNTVTVLVLLNEHSIMDHHI